MLLFLFFIVTVSTSVLINALFLKFSKNLGMRNVDEFSVRWATQTKPALGGFSFFFTFLISLLVIEIISGNNSMLTQQTSLGLIAAVFVGFLLGLSDDAYNTKPLLKLSGQILCGILLVLSNNCIHLFDNNILNITLTIFWVVAIMNSINMLDNMDGITSITSVFICLMMLMLGIYAHTLVVTDMFVIIACAASILGFLFYNVYPSKIYMGDTGSQFLGVFLSALSIKYVWNIPHQLLPQYTSPILVLIVFLLPITDTTTVTINRLLNGKSPFVGGRDHTTHYLFFNGFSERKVFLIFMVISLLSCGVLFIIFKLSTTIGVSLAMIYAIIVFLALYLPTRKGIKKK
ncbi:MAG: undecaprenyl/decaprenyl-phosphate alpha-N-acetylglucosaminyl 1-phosphate transferase [Bacteroidia bacterium]|nr:undecaprenyl/decaprenyl-phosphate alpha-N-acetylglucosaminyl 1-phosphate transferase [Bacteroidia bacterium]